MEIEEEHVKELLEHRIAQLEVKLKQERTVKKTLEQKLSNSTFCVDSVGNNAKLLNSILALKTTMFLACFSTFSGEKQLPN